MKKLPIMLLLLLPVFANAEYLGDLSANPFNPNSLANPFGAGSVWAIWQSVQ